MFSWDADMEFATRSRKTQTCAICGRIIYEDDGGKRDGYGGFLCPDCIDDKEED